MFVVCFKEKNESEIEATTSFQISIFKSHYKLEEEEGEGENKITSASLLEKKKRSKLQFTAIHFFFLILFHTHAHVHKQHSHNETKIKIVFLSLTFLFEFISQISYTFPKMESFCFCKLSHKTYYCQFASKQKNTHEIRSENKAK